MSAISMGEGIGAVEAHPPRSKPTDYAALALGVVPIALLYLCGLLLPLPYSPTHPDVAAISLAPSSQHLFGTDASGFDVFSRVIASARVDLPLAVGGAALAMLIGVPVGLVASSAGWGANALMRVVDAIQALPLLIVALAVVALAGDHIGDVLFAIMLVVTPTFIRLVRSQALVVRNARYVEAAIASGCRPGRLLRVHVLPNVSGIVLAQFAISVANAILVIAALNFLGVGVSPPTPTWGSMIATGAGGIDQGQWWVALFPSLAILLVVVCFNVIARAVEDLTQGRR